MGLDELRELPVGQRDLLLLRLRGQLFGGRVNGVADCPRCGRCLELTFALADLGFKGPRELPGPHRLLAGAYEIKFRLLNCADLEILPGEVEESTVCRVLLERCVLEAKRHDVPITVAELPESVRDQLDEELARLDPNADQQIHSSCPECGAEWLADFDIASFVWQELQSWISRTLCEVHLLACAYGWSEQTILEMSTVRRGIYLQMSGVAI
jgi:hypothetical protein